MFQTIPARGNLLSPGHDHYFKQALAQAQIAYEDGEVPVGAVAVHDGSIIARAHNQVEKLKDATAHAEMILLTQAAAALGDWRLNEVSIYVTKEPCPMCAGAMVNCRVGLLVYGLADPKYGAAGSALDVTNLPGALHRVQTLTLRGLGLDDMEAECLEIFQSFFRHRRAEERAKAQISKN